jgi:acyl carrier protein phosphodiesterase
MNYLAHAYLSFQDTNRLTGNLIADHVKGQLPLQALPPGIADGIRLHRKIDAFSDTHPAVARAKVWFRDPYHLYAGPVLDTLWDHFLANDSGAFASEDALRSFTTDTYARLESTAQWHPEIFAGYFPHMREHDWLYGYRSMRGAERALTGLSRRAKHMPAPEAAYEIFVGRYYQLAQCYFELMQDLLAYVKIEITAQGS